MIATVHLLAGAVIGLMVSNPSTIVVLSLLSHYLLDSLPHIDPGTFTEPSSMPRTWRQLIVVITDIVAVAAIGLLFYSTHRHWSLLLLGGVTALIPDLLMPLERYSFYSPFTRFHDIFHWESKLAQQWRWYIVGLATPAAIAAISALIIGYHYTI